MVGWVSPAPRRSTWSIIWSCLSIFIVCSWKCVHLNIPTHEEIQGEWHTVQLFECLPDVSFWPKAPLRRKWRPKIAWMTFIALAREFGVALAARQYVEVRRDLKTFRRPLSSKALVSVRMMELDEHLTTFSAQKYTMAHAFYVQMGGIAIYEPSPHTESQAIESNQTSSSNRHENPTTKMAHFLYIQPDMLRIPEPEIKDLSKADVITKAFAIIQCTWLVVQSISRFAHRYAISQLELATLAFIFCAFVMHVFWWNKPFDVESRRIVTAIGPDIKVPANLSTLSMDDFTVSDNALLRERVKDLSDDSLAGILDPLTAIHFNTASASFKEYLPSISLYIASTTSLAIHLAAWNWDFPSSVVRTVWRWLNLSTLVTSFTPLILTFLFALEPR
ncbi:hypothetical protein DER46DRAFT_650608 [Fusarium sp. MPI-SDFR-AT-0072]|nr:hypothetical protein DER46DRAFT_650608 [Fusarium sp. MPI-SDFR-AT-0072]